MSVACEVGSWISFTLFINSVALSYLVECLRNLVELVLPIFSHDLRKLKLDVFFRVPEILFGSLHLDLDISALLLVSVSLIHSVHFWT